jgi:predicted YcjX-like family ATPase
MAEELERLTEDTPAWYAATRAKVEARATLEQAEELRRVLDELGRRLEEDA